MLLRAFIYGIWALLCSGTLCASVKIAGEDYVDLKQAAQQLKLKYTPPQVRLGPASLQSANVNIELSENKRAITVQGISITLSYAIAANKDGSLLYLARKDLEHTLRPLLFPKSDKNKLKQLRKICIDPGHGGKDHGTENRPMHLMEKSLALDLASRVGKRLEQRGYKVVYTRTTDTFVELADRSALANKEGCDLFISLHFNSAAAADAAGIETFCLVPAGEPSSLQSNKDSVEKESYAGNRFDPWNLLVGYYVQMALVKGTKATDRGLKRSRFAVLKNLKCPGILIESGFLSNTEEAKKIADPAYRDRLAGAIVQGVETYATGLFRRLESV